MLTGCTRKWGKMAEKYHINSKGEVRPCKAVKGPCRAKPPDDIDQVHGSDSKEVYDHLARQYNDVFSGIKRKKFPPVSEVTAELVGDPSTDVERLSEVSKKKFGGVDSITEHQLWLHDTEDRPIAFIKVNEYSDRLGLCDVEVRPEYRGLKLSHRLIEATEKKLGRKMTHEGGYTPEGLRSIAPFFKSGLELATAEASFRSMTFVSDWDREWAKYPL